MKNTEKKAFDLLEASGLNWSVTKESLQTADGRKTNSFGIFRNDNQKWLGTVGNNYKPFQNSDLAMTIVSASKSINIETNSGGELGAGKKVYLQAQLPDEFIGKSAIKRYITALNSHDGTTAIAFGSSSTVVICQNTFFRAYGELEKFRHTSSAKERIENAIKNLRTTLNLDNAMFTNFKRMADLPLKDEAIERVIRKIFNTELSTEKTKISTRKENQIKSFAGALEKEIQLEGRTLWGLFNAVTRYTNHISAPTDKNERLDYLMDGGGYKLSNMGFDEIMAYVEENTVAKKFMAN
jgi:phage/plasmid-like protein (TIGR03299 family)